MGHIEQTPKCTQFDWAKKLMKSKCAEIDLHNKISTFTVYIFGTELGLHLSNSKDMKMHIKMRKDIEGGLSIIVLFQKPVYSKRHRLNWYFPHTHALFFYFSHSNSFIQ